jgi:acyl-CoA synthetase (AMP-forming)/AMP-acid ligase II
MILLPDAAEIVDLARDQRHTAGALRQAIEARTGALAAQDIGVGSIVAIAGRSSTDFFIDLFAVWRLGACAACLSATLTHGEVARLTAFAGARALLTAEGIEVISPPPAAMACAEEGRMPSLDDPALILFTSGTTGEPKGVVHSTRSLLARCALNRAEIGEAVLARTLNVLPVHFGHGLIGNCLTPLLAGGALHLWAPEGPAGVGELGRLIDAHGIGFMSSVPSFWTLALRMAEPPRRGTVKRVHVGSAPLGHDRWQAIADWAGTRQVFNAYGITETANWIGGGALDEPGSGDGYVGRLWGGQWAVRAADGTLRQSAAEGEVLVATPSLMSGYLHRPDLTAAALQDGWFATGDVGRLDEGGRLTLTGRLKDEINRAGIKVQPAEVDLLLARHPAVVDVCCFAEADPASGERVAVAIVLADGATVDGQALRDWTLQHIRRECVPERYYFLSAIPRSDRGKLNRDHVRAHCHGANASQGQAS